MEHGKEIEILERLEQVIVGPDLYDAISSAREYNERFRSGYVASNEEIVYIVNGLDETVSSYMNMPALATGIIRWPDGEGSLRENYIEDVAVVFKGFNAYKEDEDAPPKITMIVNALARQALPEDMLNEDNADFFVNVIADFGTSFDFGGMTPNHARDWLDYFYPNIVKDIDYRVFDENAKDETDQIMSMKGFDLYNHPSEDYDALFQAASAYIEGVIRVDPEVPYIIWFNDGICYVYEEDEFVKVNTEIGAPRLISSPSINYVRVNNDESGEHVLCLGGKVVSEDVEESAEQVWVPITSIKALSSLRRLYYDQE